MLLLGIDTVQMECRNILERLPLSLCKAGAGGVAVMCNLASFGTFFLWKQCQLQSKNTLQSLTSYSLYKAGAGIVTVMYK